MHARLLAQAVSTGCCSGPQRTTRPLAHCSQLVFLQRHHQMQTGHCVMDRNAQARGLRATVVTHTEQRSLYGERCIGSGRAASELAAAQTLSAQNSSTLASRRYITVLKFSSIPLEISHPFFFIRWVAQLRWTHLNLFYLNPKVSQNPGFFTNDHYSSSRGKRQAYRKRSRQSTVKEAETAS
jgi:hypothetical protein